jgi:hypothetical protein
MSKVFKISGEKIKKLIPPMGSCLATDRITVEGFPVGYMYREEPSRDGDSGWCFFAGDEPEDYINDSENLAVYDVNTIANYDKDIIPYLETRAPCAFEKVKGSSSYRKLENPSGS